MLLKKSKTFAWRKHSQRRFFIFYKRTELPVDEYPIVKDFFDKYPKKINQRIILKKIKPLWQEIKDLFARFRK